ncbi:transglycosylase domain-containing protein [Spirillospora sp. NPDC049652]
MTPGGESSTGSNKDVSSRPGRTARLGGIAESPRTAGVKAAEASRTAAGGRGRTAGAAGGPPGKPRKQRSRGARYARRAAFTVLGLIGLGIAAFAVAYLLTPVPSPSQAAVAQGPTYYYADGKTVIAKTGTNREAVPISQVPKGVREAVIAAENRSFYSDPGVSVKGTARAFWSTATGKQLQGGSTITQQMVRNYYGGIGQERSVTRKLKEVMVSLKVGREKSKDWILEQYLNTIYFGRDAYGIQAAAHAYYNKDVKDLTPSEGAYLAAAIQQPTPFGDPSGASLSYAQQRWQAVVGNMVRDHALTPAQQAQMKFPKPRAQKLKNVYRGQNGYMINVARKELIERRGYTEDEINRDGLKIVTTFDKDLMDAAKQAVTNNVPSGMSKKIRTALVSVDPSTGQVLAFYGGRNYLTEMGSSVWYDWAQPGSGFKPIVLAAALKAGYGLDTTEDGSSPQTFAGASLHNDSNESFGDVNLVTATEHSINTAYVNLGQEVGLDKVVKMAEAMGIPKSQLTANGADKAPSLPLGPISVHPIEMAGVYSTFAAGGTHRTPYVVRSVEDNKGDTEKFSEKGDDVFSDQVAADATYAMQKVVQGGTGTGAQLDDGRDVAGKTGTTNGGAAIWFNGFIPQLQTTVSMFRSDNKPLSIPGYGSYGGQLPAQIWKSYMGDAVSIKNLEAKSFDPPSIQTGYDPGPTTDRPTDRPTRVPTGKPTKPNRPTKPTIPPTDRPTHRPTDKPTGRPTPPGTGGGGGDGGGGTGGGGGGGTGELSY